MRLLFNSLFLNPLTSVSLCLSRWVSYGCQVVTVTDVQIKLNGMINSEAPTEDDREQGQGKLPR